MAYFRDKCPSILIKSTRRFFYLSNEHKNLFNARVDYGYGILLLPNEELRKAVMLEF